MTATLTLRIPATTANLGPGFDLFGLALDLYNTIRFNFHDDAGYSLADPTGNPLPIPADENLIRIAYEHMFRKLGGGKPPAWDAVVDAATAPGKGFGSSAMAVVAGVHLACTLMEAGGVTALSRDARSGTADLHADEIAGFLDLEPHPDNVVPARLGGWVFCSDTRTVIRHALPESLGLLVLIPDTFISTEKSRQTLPPLISREDALQSMRGCLLWLEYIHTGRTDYLRQALDSDRLHEPYRTPDLPGFSAMKRAALSAGCHGMTLSGSGPGVIIYFDRARQSELEPELRSRALEILGPETVVRFCKPDSSGLVYLKESSEMERTAAIHLKR